jgi:hypothetical protein
MRTLQEEKAALDKAVDEFTNDCRARLYEMAERGKRGWDDSQWGTPIAIDMHHDALRAARNGDRKHLHDIANRAMMLWWQEYRSSNAPNQAER